ncbi:MAG: nucleotide exchange factor GrpE [candidate division NC10 bacterium]|nr:nucleotide exchange factor GrpE [candidate division NC10 bacterium]MBI3002918.1 nucleotide exchange factor GrpE [candidate division NC10 bacterium]MBI4391817.1 nucleotide exchange factor GrpE [candidate division NC10 bacterium]
MSHPEQPETGARGEEAAPGPAPEPQPPEPQPQGAADPRDQELARLNDRHLRLAAEFENFKKRVARDRAEVIRTANEDLLLELLPVLDNLERALAAARKTDSTEALAEGVDLVLRLFQGVLERAGVKPIDSVGHAFDPAVHQAVAVVESPDAPDQTVVEEVQRGYWLHAKVLRPAMVKVAKAAARAAGRREGSGP